MKKKSLIIGLIVVLLVFAGCDDDDPDLSIGEITITNIPKEIAVKGSTEKKNVTFKVYLNASNSQDENDPPAAQGITKISDTVNVKDNGATYTVKIKLVTPKASGGVPPADAAPWFGTTRYYSVMISPEDVSADGVDAIWAKASMNPMNKDTAVCNWDTLMDLRGTIPLVDTTAKTQALYDGIICDDSDITK